MFDRSDVLRKLEHAETCPHADPGTAPFLRELLDVMAASEDQPKHVHLVFDEHAGSCDVLYIQNGLVVHAYEQSYN